MFSSDLGHPYPSFTPMLDEVNQCLKAAKLGIRVAQRGDRLPLRATLPPRPGSDKTKPYQQFFL
jgi:hypothetical protein